MKRHRLQVGGGLAVALCAALIALAAAPTQRADAVVSTGLPYTTQFGACTGLIVALNEPGVGISGGGVIRTVGQSLVYGGGNPCYSANVVPVGWIRTNQVLQKLSGSNWVYCSGTQTGDYYNTTLDWHKTITSNYGGSPVCGAGAYRGMGRAWVNGNGGAIVTNPLTLP